MLGAIVALLGGVRAAVKRQLVIRHSSLVAHLAAGACTMEYLDTLLRHWFPLCRSSELKDRPLARTLLGQPLALFRTPGGVGALADRCPHRNAPLSAGRARG